MRRRIVLGMLAPALAGALSGCAAGDILPRYAFLTAGEPETAPETAPESASADAAAEADVGEPLLTIDFDDLKAVAANAPQMSCLELALGAAQARRLTGAGRDRPAEADERMAAISAAAGLSLGPLLKDEADCRCDGMVALGDNEPWERRVHLLARADGALTPALLAFYPKDASGAARPLRPGEPMDPAVLAQLPPPRAASAEASPAREPALAGEACPAEILAEKREKHKLITAVLRGDAEAARSALEPTATPPRP